jgi:hypothetical protein
MDVQLKVVVDIPEKKSMDYNVENLFPHIQIIKQLFRG